MKSILLIEENRSLAAQWKSLLESQNYYVVHESTVRGGIDILRSEKIDLLITDIFIGSSNSRTPDDQGGMEIISYTALNTEPLPRMILICGDVGQSGFVDRNFGQLPNTKTLRKPVTDSELLMTVSESFSNQANEVSLSGDTVRAAETQISSTSPDLFNSQDCLPERPEKFVQLLRATQYRLEKTQFSLDHAPEGVYWIDESGKLIYANRHCSTLLGYERHELLSMSLFDLSSTLKNRNDFQANLLPKISRDGLKTEDLHIHQDGTPVPVELSARLIDYEGDRIVCIYLRDISDQKKKETELINARLLAEEGERRFRDLANSASPLIWTTELDSTCSWVDRSWLNYTGTQIENQLGFGWLDAIHPDDQEMTKSHYLKAFEQQTDFELEYRLRRYDGEYRWFRSNAAVRIDSNGQFMGFVGMSFDVHDTRLYLEQLEASREALHDANSSLRAFLDLLGTSDGVWDWKVGTEEVKYAPGFRKLLGFDGDDVVSLPDKFASFESRIHPADVGSFWDCIKQSFETKSAFSLEHRIRHRDGNYFWVRSRGMASFGIEGNAQRFAGSTYDISDVKKVEIDLEKERSALARSNEDLSQFAYVASHDLQEPLRAISGFLQLLESKYGDSLEETAKRYIEKSVAGASRMNHLINDLLLYSRVTREDAKLKPVDLNKVIATTLRDMDHQIAEASATVKFDSLPSIHGAAPLLLQLFRNLIGNSIKYRSSEDPVIHIESTETNGRIVIRVQDNGIGIDSNHRNRVFELFKRLHHREDHSGTGIGLSICKRVVDRHGGKIVVEENGKPGTCFAITFPKERTQ